MPRRFRSRNPGRAPFFDGIALNERAKRSAHCFARKYHASGAPRAGRMPPRLIIVGPPGSGRYSLARATARACGLFTVRVEAKQFGRQTIPALARYLRLAPEPQADVQWNAVVLEHVERLGDGSAESANAKRWIAHWLDGASFEAGGAKVCSRDVLTIGTIDLEPWLPAVRRRLIRSGAATESELRASLDLADLRSLAGPRELAAAGLGDLFDGTCGRTFDHVLGMERPLARHLRALLDADAASSPLWELHTKAATGRRRLIVELAAREFLVEAARRIGGGLAGLERALDIYVHGLDCPAQETTTKGAECVILGLHPEGIGLALRVEREPPSKPERERP